MSIATDTLTKSGHRPLSRIAGEIVRDMRQTMKSGICPPAALPYLTAMAELEDITDHYMHDSAISIVLYFLGNVAHWRGEKAAALKKELRDIIDEAQGRKKRGKKA